MVKFFACLGLFDSGQDGWLMVDSDSPEAHLFSEAGWRTHSCYHPSAVA